MSQDLAIFMAECRGRVEAALAHWLNSLTQPGQLREAMQYSLLNGGKRVRPLLVYASAQAVSEQAAIEHAAALDGAACALECIHAYSLVHDDLPAMDDDDLRRGQPTCHIAFGEASAILAGDALQTLAFEILSQLPDIAADTRIHLVQILTKAAGARGMVLGQNIDLAAVNHQLSLEQLEAMHGHKTGALICASLTLGACIAGASQAQHQALNTYAQAVGLAFQVQDDILDVTSDTATLGKQQGADIARNKPTYVSLLGLEAAQQKAKDLHQQALTALSGFGEAAEPLRQLSAYIVQRQH